MSLYQKQQDTRSALQDKIAKELQEKARQKAAEAELPDGVDDSQYIKGTQESGSYLWLWVLLGIFLISIAIWLVVSSS